MAGLRGFSVQLFLLDLPGLGLIEGFLLKAFGLHSPELTWKWRGAPNKTTILYIGPSISFHFNLGEGKEVVAPGFGMCLRGLNLSPNL